MPARCGESPTYRMEEVKSQVAECRLIETGKFKLEKLVGNKPKVKVKLS